LDKNIPQKKVELGTKVLYNLVAHPAEFVTLSKSSEA
jgi:hypothetical protein